MTALDALRTCSSLGVLRYRDIKRALLDDHTSAMDIEEIRAIRLRDGKAVLSARLAYIETGYELFIFPVCVYGEDGTPLYATEEGKMSNGRRETVEIGSPADVDAYAAARKDEPIRIEIDLRSQRRAG